MPEAFETFPEIVALGRGRIQQLCDEWCLEPRSAEFGVASIMVRPDCLGLLPTFEVHASNYGRGDSLHFPFDRVVEYIIDHGCHVADREGLKRRLRELRHELGVAPFQRYKVTLEAYTMALRCPACRLLLLTQYRIFKGQEFKLDWADPIACPRCGQMVPVGEGDFFPVVDPRQAGGP
jgi:hypothetical protein